MRLSRSEKGREPPPSIRGFTLIEFVAVLTIITILASMVAANVITRLKNTARSAEGVSMENMAESLRAAALRHKRIPAPSEWPRFIAQEMGHAPTRVLQTTPGFTRAFIIDPDHEIGPASAGTRKLPFLQGISGSAEPVLPRGLIVSSMGAPLPAIATNAAGFAELWNTASGQRPASWGSWVAPAEDLCIQRIQFGDLFHRVILNNLDPNNPAPYSVETLTNLTTLASGQRLELWFLKSSALNLHFANQSLQARELVRMDTSYVFENGMWTRYLNYGIRPPLAGFGLLAEDFRLSPVPPNNKFGATPQAVIEEFFNFLYTYGQWATGNPPETGAFETGGSNSDQQVPAYQALLNAQKSLEIFSSNLIN